MSQEIVGHSLGGHIFGHRIGRRVSHPQSSTADGVRGPSTDSVATKKHPSRKSEQKLKDIGHGQGVEGKKHNQTQQISQGDWRNAGRNKGRQRKPNRNY